MEQLFLRLSTALLHTLEESMQPVLIFRGGHWISVSLPKGLDPKWTSKDSLYFASAWLSAKEKWGCEKKATSLAEAAVYKRLYEGLVYNKTLEHDLQQLWS